MHGLVTTGERALAELRRVSNTFPRLPSTGPADWLGHRVMAALHGLLAAACEAELAGASFEAMREATAVARTFHTHASSIIAHTQRWPRGYPGDFEIIETLMTGQAAGSARSIEHTLDRCLLQLPIVWQHRSKLAWQAALVRARLGRRQALRVLSIACGGSRDLMLLDDHELPRLSVVLTDLDADALALSRTRFEARLRELTCVHGNVLRLANRLRAAGPYDVVVIGGLLDYLPERAARLLLEQAVAMLAPDGVLGATNLAAGNPWRLMLQLIADWSVLERSEDEMLRLFSLPGAAAEVSLDDTRLTWLATAIRSET
jgi:SAM-dependent methyltransferase